MLALQRQEVVSRAKFDVITLSELRTGAEEQARRDLEQHLDIAVATVYLSDKRSPGGPANDAVKLFQLAKVYHSSFPPGPSSPAALKEALDSVPMSSLTFCSPALRKTMAELQNSPGAAKTH